ncbi:hypothetical protein CDV36_013535 [Fusarium kuroshium]|uniref:Peptidase S33 tripeptidyl aminopeptidase-like C-terminal domain-containing protein n=2 Tax=Fusarium solani species complex TaxID=232080 RepID=A0A3M2RNN1_9HYPO|nr:hypothetical protein CDV36_013535 [Fusarium kuroshium]RSL73512.1 hypothetical protein CEP51_011739 [Fusarium floridanum]
MDFEPIRNEDGVVSTTVREYHAGYVCTVGFQTRDLYDGDLNVTTRNPVLIIGNEWDPVTPWPGAFNLSESFVNSVAVKYKAFGHTTVAQNSDCTWNVINKYFMEGEVPPPGSVCELDEYIF